MTWEQATDALLQHFRTRWIALHAAVPIHFPNATPVTGANVESKPWVRLTFQPSFSERVAVGGQLRLQGGQAVVGVFVPLGTGDGVSTSYGRDIEAIWETAHANGLSGDIILAAPEPLSNVRDPDIPAWRSGVAISFTIAHSPS